MKKCNFLLLLFIVLSACGPEVPPPPTEQVPDASAAWMQAIDLRKTEIDRLLSQAELKYDSLQYDCKSGQEGGVFRLFKAKDSLRLIRHLYYAGEHSSGQVNLYVDQATLIYAEVTERLLSLDADAPKEDGTTHRREDISEYRYYFEPQGQLVRCFQKTYFLRTSVALPTNTDKIEEVEISSGGGAFLQGFFKQVVAAQDEGTLRSLFCAD